MCITLQGSDLPSSLGANRCLNEICLLGDIGSNESNLNIAAIITDTLVIPLMAYHNQRTLICVFLTGYCHIGFQRGRVPTQVRAGRLDNEGGVRGAWPNRMKM
jgi:hypothetical protein